MRSATAYSYNKFGDLLVNNETFCRSYIRYYYAEYIPWLTLRYNCGQFLRYRVMGTLGVVAPHSWRKSTHLKCRTYMSTVAANNDKNRHLWPVVGILVYKTDLKSVALSGLRVRISHGPPIKIKHGERRVWPLIREKDTPIIQPFIIK